MALANKYMSMTGLCSYMKVHCHLIVVTCLSIAIKIDSPTIAVICQERSQVAEDIPSNLYCVESKYCTDAKSSSQASNQSKGKETIDPTNNGAGVKSSQPPRRRKRAGPIGPTTYARGASSSSSETRTGSSSDAATQSLSESEGVLDGDTASNTR